MLELLEKPVSLWSACIAFLGGFTFGLLVAALLAAGSDRHNRIK